MAEAGEIPSPRAVAPSLGFAKIPQVREQRFTPPLWGFWNPLEEWRPPLASGNPAAFVAGSESPIGEIACPRRIEILECLDFWAVGDSIRIVRATAAPAILSERNGGSRDHGDPERGSHESLKSFRSPDLTPPSEAHHRSPG